MIIISPQGLRGIPRGNPIGQNVVSGLDMEGLLDLGIRRDNKVEEDQRRD